MTITQHQKIEELKLSMGLAYSRETAEVFRAILADYEAPDSVRDAAPFLLAALETMLAYVWLEVHSPATVKQITDQARAAIAAARGTL